MRFSDLSIYPAPFRWPPAPPSAPTRSPVRGGQAQFGGTAIGLFADGGRPLWCRCTAIRCCASSAKPAAKRISRSLQQHRRPARVVSRVRRRRRHRSAAARKCRPSGPSAPVKVRPLLERLRCRLVDLSVGFAQHRGGSADVDAATAARDACAWWVLRKRACYGDIRAPPLAVALGPSADRRSVASLTGFRSPHSRLASPDHRLREHNARAFPTLRLPRGGTSAGDLTAAPRERRRSSRAAVLISPARSPR